MSELTSLTSTKDAVEGESPFGPKTPPRTPKKKPIPKPAQDFYGWTPFMVNGKIVVKEPKPAPVVDDEPMEIDELLESETLLRSFETPSRGRRPPNSGRSAKLAMVSSVANPATGEQAQGESAKQ